MAIAVGQPAPNFTLQDQDQKDISLADYRGKNVVLVLYPLDFSPLCTNEHACFVNELNQFDKLNAQVIGLSVDSVWTHKAFAEKMRIGYPLLADFHPRGAVAEKLGLYNAERGTANRAIVIVDKTGRVAWVKNYEYPNIPEMKEVEQALAQMK